MKSDDAREESNASDKVWFFGQWMTRDWAQALAAAQEQSLYRSESELLPRIPFGLEGFRNPENARTEPCRHCGTIFGKLHDPGCDYEECPVCHGQVMSCDCDPTPTNPGAHGNHRGED